MANTHTSLSALFTDIADAIREKTGDTGTIVADEFPDYIRENLQKVTKPYLTFSSPNEFTIGVNNATKNWDGTLEYSTNKNDWNTWDGTTTIYSAAIGSKYVLYLRGTGNTNITADSSKARWAISGTDLRCDGNIENLLDYATVKSGGHPTMNSSCYAYMFYGCTSLTQAPSLPATTLTDYCYYYMFYGCTSLTQAPSLPATTLTDYCYGYMFRGCASLTQAPSLPATTMKRACYQYMFADCTSLTQAPSLPATTLTDYCYPQMFMGCTKIKLSSTQTGEYTQAYRIPISGNGTATSKSLYDMFSKTGGTFTGAPSINTTYYLSNTNTIV